MAAALLRRHLDDAAVPAHVTSAGTRSTSLPVDFQAVAVMADRGLDLRGHVPRRIDRTVLTDDGADLVVTMTREHLREVVAMDGSAWPRAFTLRELVRRATANGVRSQPGWAEWLARLAAPRRPADLLVPDPADDIADPYGMSLATVRRVGGQLDDLTGRLAALLRPDAARHAPLPAPPDPE